MRQEVKASLSVNLKMLQINYHHFLHLFWEYLFEYVLPITDIVLAKTSTAQN